MSDQWVTIKVNNVENLVKQQGGAAGEIAFKLAPQTVSNTVYSKLKDQLAAALKEKGVEADVTITSSPATGAPAKGELLTGLALGAGGVGIAYGVVKLVGHLIKKGKK